MIREPKKILSLVILGISALLISVLLAQTPSATEEMIVVPGVTHPVEIIKDDWGISHIFAQNQKDLFFAQGYNTAQDRLFQLEVWRRQATGTLAEILGRKALNADIGSRLLRARLDMAQEMNHYHPQGEEIITSFVRGINAYIALTEKDPSLLSLEFKLLGLKPGEWTPEVVVSRHNGLFRNVTYEITLAQAVDKLGTEKIQELVSFHPGIPNLNVDEKVSLSMISNKILELYLSSRSSVRFDPEDIVEKKFRAKKPSNLASFAFPHLLSPWSIEADQGSNNWVVRGKLTFTGFPMMANDPHRSLKVPSLRYWAHLVAPGWNVIGGGEPALPGISIGHNEYGAWGLTIFSVDQEDLCVYETNPENPNLYKYGEDWEEMTVIRETIPIKGRAPMPVDLKYTRHGPVLYEDSASHTAYALRAAWLEIGGAPYLASLRMDQAKNWREFREACSFSYTPSENMVWADREDNIGWQAVGITPLRKSWSGLLPIPGDGRFEWDGYLPIKNLPHTLNPPEGFFATANQDNIPKGYPYAIGFVWTDPYRFARIQEVLGSGRKFTLTDMMALQQDVLSIPARTLVPFLKTLQADETRTEEARQRLCGWDCRMDEDSAAAALYMSWEKRLQRNIRELFFPEEARSALPRLSLKKMIEWLTAPDGRFGLHPVQGRDELLIKSLEEAVQDLVQSLGPDRTDWKYGHEQYHHILIRHMLSGAVREDIRAKLDVGPTPRGGNGYTVNMTTDGFNQTSGASFRIIADLENWDNSLGTNCPGQSGNPGSPHYADLFEPWAKGQYFPVLFSRAKIESAARLVIRLIPEGSGPD